MKEVNKSFSVNFLINKKEAITEIKQELKVARLHEKISNTEKKNEFA